MGRATPVIAKARRWQGKQVEHPARRLGRLKAPLMRPPASIAAVSFAFVPVIASLWRSTARRASTHPDRPSTFPAASTAKMPTATPCRVRIPKFTEA